MKYLLFLILSLTFKVGIAEEKVLLGKLENFEIQLSLDSIELTFNKKKLIRVGDNESVSLRINFLDSLVMINGFEFDLNGNRKIKSRWEKYCDADHVLEVIPFNQRFFIVNNYQAEKYCRSQPFRNQNNQDSLMLIDGFYCAIYPVFDPGTSYSYIYDRIEKKQVLKDDYVQFYKFYNYLFGSSITHKYHLNWDEKLYQSTIFNIEGERIDLICKGIVNDYSRDTFLVNNLPTIDSIKTFNKYLDLVYTSTGVDLWRFYGNELDIDHHLCIISHLDSIGTIEGVANGFIAYKNQTKILGIADYSRLATHVVNGFNIKTYKVIRQTSTHQTYETEIQLFSFSPLEHIIFDQSYFNPKSIFVFGPYPLNALDSTLHLVDGEILEVQTF